MADNGGPHPSLIRQDPPPDPCMCDCSFTYNNPLVCVFVSVPTGMDCAAAPGTHLTDGLRCSSTAPVSSAHVCDKASDGLNETYYSVSEGVGSYFEYRLQAQMSVHCIELWFDAAENYRCSELEITLRRVVHKVIYFVFSNCSEALKNAKLKEVLTYFMPSFKETISEIIHTLTSHYFISPPPPPSPAI